MSVVQYLTCERHNEATEIAQNCKTTLGTDYIRKKMNLFLCAHNGSKCFFTIRDLDYLYDWEYKVWDEIDEENPEDCVIVSMGSKKYKEDVWSKELTKIEDN